MGTDQRCQNCETKRRAVGRRLPETAVRFGTIGVLNTGIDVVLFWALHGPLGILLANFVSTSAGMSFSFLANGRHTFGGARPTLRQAVLFVGTNALTMWLFQPLLIHTAYDVVRAPLMVAKVVGLGGSVVANFLLYRHLVWPAEVPGRAPRGARKSPARCQKEPREVPGTARRSASKGHATWPAKSPDGEAAAPHWAVSDTSVGS